MGNQKKKLIFFDIDGTLMINDEGPFDDDLAAMEEAAGKGHYLFLNTGRAFANIPPALLGLPFLKGIASGGGAHILLASAEKNKSAAGPAHLLFRTIHQRQIETELLSRICAFYMGTSLCCILEGVRDCYILNRTDRSFTVRPPLPVNFAEDFFTKSSGDAIIKLTFGAIATEGERLLVESAIKVNDFSDYSEGIIKGENKAKAMELLLDEFRLTRDDCIAIGDGANDLDMIRFAGLGIAMGNACDELKAAAGAITGPCGKGGVAQALRKLLQG